MNQSFLLRIAVCILAFGFCLYSYLDLHNKVIDLRMRIPELSKELTKMHGENTRLQYEIDVFENPGHLMELARQKEFRHLKSPTSHEILVIGQAAPLEETDEKKEIQWIKPKPKITFAVGVKP